MLKKLSIFFLLLSVAHLSTAKTVYVNTDTLLKIVHINDQYRREKALVNYFKSYFLSGDIDVLPRAKVEFNSILSRYKTENREGFDYSMEAIYQGRLSHLNVEENLLLRAIESVSKNSDHYLSYVFLNYLAFTQTSEGDVIGSVSSYRLAKKEAALLRDPFLELSVDVNISDVYYKFSLYNQSLSYLNLAQQISYASHLDNQYIKNVIFYNKSENFFRMDKVDSLRKYSELLKASKTNIYNAHTYIRRTNYYLLLLNGDYRTAIQQILRLKKDSLFKFYELDNQNLAVAYFKGGEPDSAKSIINKLLLAPGQINHPETKYRLYSMLGDIEETKHNYPDAALNYKTALQQATEISRRLTQVGNISSQMRIDELESAYIQKSEVYKRQQIWLIFTIVVSFLIIVVIAMFYRNITQKRHYENILYKSKKEELAFINSHEVRKHLSNILGIIYLIRHSKDKKNEYLQVQDHLYKSAESLDTAIKNISEKLDN